MDTERRQSQKQAHGAYIVRIDKPALHFPLICPHCHSETSWTVAIESPREFAGYFVAFTRWRYSTINVPFCGIFAKRVKMAEQLFLIGMFFGLLSVVVIGWTKEMDSWKALLIMGAILLPFSVPKMLWRPSKYVALREASATSIEFEVRRRDYACTLAAANGGTIE